MNKPLVSIVSPSYNQVQFIEECIQSVITQDYLNIEYFIFDGGSTDGSIEIIKKYHDKLSYWVSEKDGGQSDAINKGWKMANGELLFYLNTDDCLSSPNVVSRIVEEYLKDNSGSVFYGDCIIIDEKGEEKLYKKAKDTNFTMLLKKRIFADILYQTSCFFNARYVREIGYLDEKLHYCMDYKLIVELSRKGNMYRIDGPVAKFRIHSESKSHKGMIPMMEEQIKIKFSYNVLYSLIYAFHYVKFRAFKLLPVLFQKNINPKLYKSLNN